MLPHSHLIRATLLVLTVLAVTRDRAAAQSDTPASTTHGRLVIIGGGLSRTNDDVYDAVLSGRRGAGPICVIPTAGGGDPARTIASMVAAFDGRAGAGTAAGIPVSTANPEAAADPAVVQQIRRCSGFYFTGGVQSRVVAVFRPGGRSTPAYEALMSGFREGAVVAGSSAGAAIMSDPMIAGGSTTGALATGVQRGTAEADEDGDAAGNPDAVLVTPGLGFFDDAVVDQHFLARGRIGRLIAAVLDLDDFGLGFGIDENTALVVDRDSVHVVGVSGVIVIDARAAERNGRSATGVKLHLLGAGDGYAIPAGRVYVTTGKAALPASADSVAAPEDVFARWSFLHVLHQFARSAQAHLTLAVDGGVLVLRKGPDFVARANETDGVRGTPSGLSITGLLLDVKR